MTETESVAIETTHEATESVTTETPFDVTPNISAYGVLDTIRRMASDATYILSREDDALNDPLRRLYFQAAMNAIAELIDLVDVNTHITFVKPSDD